MLGELLENLRKTRPIIHNITNYVTVNDCANVLLACGASPIMADDEAEAAEITALCGGLVINIGTLNSRTIPSMFAAGKKAGELGRPAVLDPVGAGASQLRTSTALKLMKEVKFAVIRGNASEIRTIAHGSGTTRGVDVDEADAVGENELDAAADFVKKLAARLGCVISMSGAVDIISDGADVYLVRNGRPEMSFVTGTGCQLSALTAAFAAAKPEEALKAALAAACLMGVCGEMAWERMGASDGNSTYRNHIIDAVCRITPQQLNERAKYEMR